MKWGRRELMGMGIGVASFGALSVAGGAAAQQPQRRTTGLGTQSEQFLLSKISVTNLVRSYRFYTEIIGLSPASPRLAAPTDADPEQDFREFPLNYTASLADPFFVIMKRRGISPTPELTAMITIGFKVADVRATLDRAARAGFTAGRRDPRPGTTMLIGHINDPDGYDVELIQSPPFSP